jgi:hypothetical protein
MYENKFKNADEFLEYSYLFCLLKYVICVTVVFVLSKIRKRPDKYVCHMRDRWSITWLGSTWK